MKTVAQPARLVNWNSRTENHGPDFICPGCGNVGSRCTCSGRRHIHTQHGADRAILGLSRTGCRNDEQRSGFDAMTAEIAAWHRIAADNVDDEGWGAQLQGRLEAAERRRAYAIQIAGTHETVLAAGAVFNVAIYNAVEVYA